MPIRIKCPKCQAALAVKDALAGKRVSCPKCRNSLAIPALKVAATKTAPEPDLDIEAEALKAFADEPVKPAAAPKFVEFECPFCVEKVKVNAELAGKQAPCPNPECKRIVKVPALKEDKPKDWRQINTRLAGGLLKSDEKEPEGAWGTAQTMRVSTEALIEANAIPVKKVPVTARTWIRRGVWALVAVALVAGASWGIMAWMAGGRAQAALNSALEQAKSNANIKPPAAASILRGAAQFHGASGKTDDANKLFSEARVRLGTAPADGKSDVSRDAALIGLTLAWMEFMESQGADWSDPVRQTLAKLGSVEAKQTAVREIATRLLKKNQGEKAIWLANQVAPPATSLPPPEPSPLPDKKGEPEKSKPAPARSPLVGQQIAMLLANGKAAEAAKIEPPPTAQDKDKDKDAKELELAVRLGYAEGKARLGEYAAAREFAMMKGLESHQLEASVAIAAIAVGQDKTQQAKDCAQDALKNFNILQARRSLPPPWVLIQLARVCARAEMAGEAKQVSDAIPDDADKEAKALAQLERLLVKLEGSSSAVTPAAVDEIITAKGTLGHGLGLEKAALHNMLHGGRSDALALMEGLDEAQKAFVWIGIAVGSVADKTR